MIKSEYIQMGGERMKKYEISLCILVMILFCIPGCSRKNRISAGGGSIVTSDSDSSKEKTTEESTEKEDEGEEETEE